jgi:hypothetical protein
LLTSIQSLVLKVSPRFTRPLALQSKSLVSRPTLPDGTHSNKAQENSPPLPTPSTTNARTRSDTSTQLLLFLRLLVSQTTLLSIPDATLSLVSVLHGVIGATLLAPVSVSVQPLPPMIPLSTHSSGVNQEENLMVSVTHLPIVTTHSAETTTVSYLDSYYHIDFSLTLSSAFKPSPQAGQWNQAYFEQLLANAKPSF